MALAVHVAGLGGVLVQVDDNTGPGLQSLGYTINGAELSEEPFHVDVPGDQNGGERGPPIEIQVVGEVDHVRLEMTNYDEAVLNLVRANIPTATAGQFASTNVGQLLFANTKYFRVRLNGGNEPRTYNRAIPRGAREINKGSIYSRAVVEFECHKDASGVIYTAT
ncbi:MAG TPA: hypothetical protein VG125_19685 [Pirellulales bacterium]|jgi:hypothetical protein|nr:hypothetical protein [Pirellulales bacterium]